MNAPVRPIRWPLIVAAIGGLVFGCIYFGTARAAEHPTDRIWIVWNEGEDKAWISRKTGMPATATGPTACSLALHEVAVASPKGTRLACRRVKP